MSSKYLLPCLCGQQIPIEPRQAGETIACGCGASLQAPTMREICALEPAPAEPSLPRAGATWGWRHGLRLLGAAILLGAIAWGVWLYLKPPVSPFGAIDPEVVRQNFQRMSPAATWDTWQAFHEGLDRRVDQKYADKMAVYRIQQGLPILLAVIGVGLIVVGMAPVKPRPVVAETQSSRSA